MGLQVRCESLLFNGRIASETANLEYRRGEWNFWWSGEMRRYQKERRRRKRFSGLLLTLSVRKLAEQTGLDTPVVLALNDGH